MVSFLSLFKVVKNIERPSKCSSHEKCILMLLNEMYQTCGYLKTKFTDFDAMANKIKAEKLFLQGQQAMPQLEKTHPHVINAQQFKPDDLLISMITTTE